MLQNHENMKSNQRNSFNPGGTPPRRSDGGAVALPNPFQLVVWVLRKTALIAERLFVLARYQFYKTTALHPSQLAVSWPTAWRLSVIAALAFVAMKRDVNVSLGEQRDMAHFAAMDAMAIPAVMPLNPAPQTKAAIAAPGEKADFFADAPEDDAETLTVKAYVRRFRKVAKVEMEKYGIPASVKMAQAILESNAGRSLLSTKNNNHFGMKCFSRTCKKGHCSNFGDDSHKDFFRKYNTAWESWRSHSKLIANGKYKSLLKYGNDYKKWAKGLKQLGYATARHYDQTLIELIEKYRLYELDY